MATAPFNETRKFERSWRSTELERRGFQLHREIVEAEGCIYMGLGWTIDDAAG